MPDNTRLRYKNIDLGEKFLTVGQFFFSECFDHIFLCLPGDLLRLFLSYHITAVILQRENGIQVFVEEILRCFLMQVDEDMEQVLPRLKGLVGVEEYPYDRSDGRDLAFSIIGQKFLLYLCHNLFCIFQLGVDIDLSVQVYLGRVEFGKEFEFGQPQHTYGRKNNEGHQQKERALLAFKQSAKQAFIEYVKFDPEITSVMFELCAFHGEELFGVQRQEVECFKKR